MRPLIIAPIVLGLLACIPTPDVSEAAPGPTPETQQRTPAPMPLERVRLPDPVAFEALEGELTQGGWIRGVAPAATQTLTLGEETVPIAPDGRFFAAFDRDAGSSAMLTAVLEDGRVITEPLGISPRDWDIEHVNVARRSGGASEAFMARRRPELEAIGAARAQRTGATGWRQDFVWPVTGRISGRFGSQRIYRGEPGSYHSGIDVARPTGTPFVAPADGVVVLAAQSDFSLEGKLLMIDHGNGLNSAFLHCDSLAVREGDMVRQGQVIGTVGSSGRATGPHLHWSLKWFGARLDPLLFTGPMG